MMGVEHYGASCDSSDAVGCIQKLILAYMRRQTADGERKPVFNGILTSRQEKLGKLRVHATPLHSTSAVYENVAYIPMTTKNSATFSKHMQTNRKIRPRRAVLLVNEPKRTTSRQVSTAPFAKGNVPLVKHSLVDGPHTTYLVRPLPYNPQCS